jgi:hypothetical protein
MSALFALYPSGGGFKLHLVACWIISKSRNVLTVASPMKGPNGKVSNQKAFARRTIK